MSKIGDHNELRRIMTCPVCLEKMDVGVGGGSVVFCRANHGIHVDCLGNMLMHKVAALEERSIHVVLGEVLCPLCRGEYDSHVLKQCAKNVVKVYSMQTREDFFAGLFMNDAERLEFLCMMRRGLAKDQCRTLVFHMLYLILFCVGWSVGGFFFPLHAKRYYPLFLCFYVFVILNDCLDTLYSQARKHLEYERLIYSVCMLVRDARHSFMAFYSFFLYALAFFLRGAAVGFTVLEIRDRLFEIYHNMQ